MTRQGIAAIIFLMGMGAGIASVDGSPVPSSAQECRECHVAAPVQDREKCPICHFSATPRDLVAHPPTPTADASPISQKKPPPPPKGMALIPAGEFTMGYDKRHPDEGPAHTVTLSAFYIDRYEVTNAEYAEFVKAAAHSPPAHWQGGLYPGGKEKHPVVMVSWHDAKDYCKWTGKRLPTEQEWEKAARGTDARIFPWGNEFDLEKSNSPQRWKSKRMRGDTMPVGSFPEGKSPYGLYDMAGNVWEWTENWYLPHPGNTRLTENYGKKYRVAKGGSWKNCSFYRCGISGPTFNRGFFDPNTTTASFGFRCAKDSSPRKKK